MDDDTPAVKKPVRARKITKPAGTEETVTDTPTVKSSPASISLTNSFDNLISQITDKKQEFEDLQSVIAQTRKNWLQEQHDRELEVTRKKQQEDLDRQREQETYQYNLNLTRKRAEDEFADKKLAWEKELAGRKEQLEKEKQELETLRKQVTEFDSRIEQSVKTAESDTAARITAEFEAEKKLREQEVKSEKEILGLKIEGLSAEVKRQAEEITVLKRSVDQAQQQVKDIAVKVIEGGTPKTQTQQE